MTFAGQLFIQEEGAGKVTLGIIVFLMNIFLPMVMIPFQYKKMIAHKNSPSQEWPNIFLGWYIAIYSLN